jgi:hypothetical protein
MLPGGRTFISNTSTCEPEESVMHPRRWHPWWRLLCEPHILHGACSCCSCLQLNECPVYWVVRSGFESTSFLFLRLTQWNAVKLNFTCHTLQLMIFKFVIWHCCDSMLVGRWQHSILFCFDIYMSKGALLSYDVAHRTVRPWRQNSFRCFLHWPWNTLRNRVCGVACCRKEWGKLSAVFLQPIQDRGLYRTEEWFYKEPCFP